jgi:hypothetical protein
MKNFEQVENEVKNNWKKCIRMRFAVLMVVRTSMLVFWVVTLYGLCR